MLAELVAKNFGQNEPIKDLVEIAKNMSPMNKLDKESKSPIKSKNDAKKLQPFTNMVSRDGREKTLSPKKISSSAAYYQPKYESVDK